jgi:hypothetical protein
MNSEEIAHDLKTLVKLLDRCAAKSWGTHIWKRVEITSQNGSEQYGSRGHPAGHAANTYGNE